MLSNKITFVIGFRWFKRNLTVLKQKINCVMTLMGIEFSAKVLLKTKRSIAVVVENDGRWNKTLN